MAETGSESPREAYGKAQLGRMYVIKWPRMTTQEIQPVQEGIVGVAK